MATKSKKKTGKKAAPLAIRDLPARSGKTASVKGGAVTKRTAAPICPLTSTSQ